MSDTKHCDFCGKDVTFTEFRFSLSLWNHKADQEELNDDICATCKPKVRRAIDLVRMKGKKL